MVGCLASFDIMLKTLVLRSLAVSQLSNASLINGSACSCSSTVCGQDLITTDLSRHYGQPTAKTHPHLLKHGEITPGITLEEYRSRRRRLMESISRYFLHITQQTKRHMIVVPSASKLYMSEKIPYPFRQNSDFLYLTGFLEPDSVLVLKSDPQKGHEEILFVPKRDPHTELWDGPQTGADGAVELVGVDEAYNTEDLPNFLSAMLRDFKSMALWCDFQNVHHPFVEQCFKLATSDTMPKFMNSPRPLLQQLKVIKSPAESALLAQSCSIASRSFVDVIRDTEPLMTEHQLYAKMDYSCRNYGADRLAYPPVVAGGDRANIIHYIANSQLLLQGEVVLMDAGCEYGGYVSDITRSWPVTSTFSSLHKELYEAVLNVQEQLIRFCNARLSLDQLYTKMIGLLGDRLQELGVISKNVSHAERSKLVQKYCPHHVGHYLGMDVHDTPLITRSRLLEPGMVITIEPGIYIRKSDTSAPRELRGVGIRIEDNILITDAGPSVLSKDCPKTVAAIESLRTSKSST